MFKSRWFISYFHLNVTWNINNKKQVIFIDFYGTGDFMQMNKKKQSESETRIIQLVIIGARWER